MLCFKLLDHFLLLIISGRFEVRTVLYTFLTSLGLIFVNSFVADRTRFISFLIDDCSILGLLASSRMILVTQRALMWLVTFRRKSRIDKLVHEHLLGYLSLLLQIVEEVSPSSEFLLAPSPGNVLGEVLGHKSNIFFIILQ